LETSSTIPLGSVQILAWFLLKCIHARLITNEVDALSLLRSTWFGLQCPASIPLFCAAAVEYLRSSGSALNIEALLAAAQPRYQRLIAHSRDPSAYKFTYIRTPTSSDRGFIFERPDGALQCRLLGIACAESDLDLESGSRQVVAMDARAVSGWCSTSKQDVFEFLCGDVVKSHARLLESIDVRPVLLRWFEKLHDQVRCDFSHFFVFNC
jgi:hypothetical protein